MSGHSDGTSADKGGHGYTGSRLAAIESGCLYDVSEVADKTGFKWHVAMTRDVWDECVKWHHPEVTDEVFQAEKLRLIDVLRICAYKIRLDNPDTSRMPFSVMRIPRDGSSDHPVRVELVIVAHLGDDDEPVLTITKSSDCDDA